MIIALAILLTFLIPGNLTWTATALMFCVPTRGIRYEHHHFFFIIWMMWAATSCILSPWSEMALYGYGMRMEGLLTWVVLARLAWAAWEKFPSWSMIFRVLAVSAVTVMVACMFPDSSWMHDFSMPTIAFVNMAALLVIILWAFDWRVAILASPACLACNTRGAMLGMVIGILIYCCVIWKHRVKKKVILGILILVGVIALSPAGRKMAKIDVHTMGTGPRSQWMMQAIQASKERPMLGYGLDTLSHVLKPASGAFGTGDLKNPTIADRTHNIFLDMLLQTGWIGLALFVTTVGMAVKCALNHPSVNNAISLSVLGGWIVTGLFNPTGITATLIMLMALFAIGRDEKE